MGRIVERRPVLHTGGAQGAVQTLTSTGTRINGGAGVAILGAGGSTTDKVFLIDRPSAAGVQKTIVVNATGAQKVSVTVGGATTAGLFHGTTNRTIAFTTNSTKRRNALLVSRSTTTWDIIAMSTGTTLAG